jgi:putative transposase
MPSVDNGSEFISKKLDTWCQELKIHLHFILPGKAMQNDFIERCNAVSEVIF